MNYQETIDYLYAQLPMFSRIGSAAYKADLHNTILLCGALGHPENQFKSIHIAGTNGKGSTSHMLAAILQEAGYKTGLYTSPHLKDFRERIRINGKMIDPGFIVDFVAKTRSLSEEIEPSFFELTVAMAFDYFATEQVDIAVVETGLGGRLDSTNVIHPILSVITNIGYDHMNILGDTLEKIAAEKAGIIKEGVPVVIGEVLPVTLPIFSDKASACHAHIVFAQEEYICNEIWQTAPGKLECSISDTKHHQSQQFELQLAGRYQTKNLCTVLCAVDRLLQLGFKIKAADARKALAHTTELTGLHGRWELIARQPAIVLDVAHNEDGIRQVLDQIVHLPQDTQLHLVIGMVKDKEVSKVLSLLPNTAQYYFTQAQLPRALEAIQLKESAAVFGLTGEVYHNVNAAIAAARENAGSNDWIIVCGSVFLVGEVDVDLWSGK